MEKVIFGILKDMFNKNLFIRNIEANSLLEIFFVSAVSSLLLIRFYLFVMRYPQLGNGNLHIAHMLWGGLLMLIALVLTLSFLSRSALRLSAIIGGLGFGIFIDELGKFITSDNNYFYQPTVALLYVIFVLIFLLFRAIPQYSQHTQKEYLINAIDMLKEAVINDLDVEEERLAKQYLKRSNSQDPIVKSLFQLLDQIETIELRKPGMLTYLRNYARNLYQSLASKVLFTRIVVFILIFETLSAIIGMGFVLKTDYVLSYDKWGVLITAVFSSIFVVFGIINFRISRMNAYRQFKTSVFILIFLTQFFLFYSAQFQALIALIINLGVYLTIEYVLTLEKEAKRMGTNKSVAAEDL